MGCPVISGGADVRHFIRHDAAGRHYCAIVTGFLISALGGSRVQIGGPIGAFVVVVSGIIAAEFHRHVGPRNILPNVQAALDRAQEIIAPPSSPSRAAG